MRGTCLWPPLWTLARFSVLIVVASCVLARAAAGQTPVNDMPSDRTVPGFSIIDSSIMSIEHTDPLHTTVLTLFSTLRNDDLLPRDVGVELLPFLVRSVSRGTPMAKAYDNQYNSRFAKSLLQFTGVSLAISQHGDALHPEAAFSQLAIGVRTFVRKGRTRSALDTLLNQYDQSTQKLDEAIKIDAPETASLLTQTRGLRDEIERSDKTRVGLMLEAGTGVALRVPQNLLSESTAARIAYWLTPIYRWDEAPLAVSGIARFIAERERDQHIVDVGGRITGRIRGIVHSGEGILRLISEQGPETLTDHEHTRMVYAVSYAFSRGRQVHFTLGKNYSDNVSQNGTLNASFGVTFGLGELELGE